MQASLPMMVEIESSSNVQALETSANHWIAKTVRSKSGVIKAKSSPERASIHYPE
jgi:hypothetical protein